MTREELLALSVQAEKVDAESKSAELEFQLEQLKRLIFGARSERFVAPANPNQRDTRPGACPANRP